MKLLEILNKNVYHWYKSLDIIDRITIANFYRDSMGVSDIIENGLTEDSQEWLVQNYTDDLKDYIILKYNALG